MIIIYNPSIIDLDLGSDHTWLPDISCQTCRGGIHLDQSETYNHLNANITFNAHYVSGTVSGFLAEDVITLGSIQTSSVPIGVITESHLGSVGNIAEFNGLVGLGPNSTILHSLFDSVTITDPTLTRSFSFYLSSSDNDDSGTFTVGGWDDTKRDGDIRWFPCSQAVNANAALHWTLPFVTLTLGGILSDPTSAM